MNPGSLRAIRALLALTLCAGALCQDVIKVKEGQNAEFKCNYPSTYQNPRVEWKFNSGSDTGFVYYAGSLTDPYKNRADVYPQGLRLRSVTRKDSGYYACEVTNTDGSGNTQYQEIRSQLVVLVPPAIPIAQVPTSVTTGSMVQLVCNERDSSPPATYVWYKNNVQMPEDSKSSPTFQNSSYTIDPATGILKYPSVMKSDAGDYSCMATNTEGTQTSATVRMEVHDVNVGGIVAAVIIVLLLLGLIAFGVWFAYSRGYIGKKSNKKVIYSQPSETRSDKNFQQTSSFLV